jgi:membrane protein DedA with SNARE-associated domain
MASVYAGAVLWAFISTTLGYFVAPWLIDSVVH